MPSSYVADFDKRLAGIVSQMQIEIAQALKSGELMSLSASARLTYIAEFYPELDRILRESGYFDLVNKLNKDSAGLVKNLRDIYAINKVPLAFVKSDVKVLTALNQMTFTAFEHIGSQAMQSVHTALMQGVLSGVSDKQVANIIQSEMTDRFQRYATTYANTARQEFAQRVAFLSAEQTRQDGDVLYWEYVGAEDDKNRDACVIGLAQRYFTDAEMQEFEATYADERAYNCRHIFVEVTKEMYDEGAKGENDLTDDELERRQEIIENI